MTTEPMGHTPEQSKIPTAAELLREEAFPERPKTIFDTWGELNKKYSELLAQKRKLVDEALVEARRATEISEPVVKLNAQIAALEQQMVHAKSYSNATFPYACSTMLSGEAPADFEDTDLGDTAITPKKKSFMVVAALVAAMGVGGGLAFGYKKFVKPPTDVLLFPSKSIDRE